MLNDSHLCEILRSQEIDISFIDHSLSYHENKDNLYKQFGVKFNQTNYNKDYVRFEAMANEYAKDKGLDASSMLSKAKIRKVGPTDASQVEHARSEATRSPGAPKLPFDVIDRSKEIESFVMDQGMRRYYRFRWAPFYGPAGIVTGDMLGCNFLCAYCWNYARNEKPGYDAFHSPGDVAAKLRSIAKGKSCSQYRLSGAEPFLGKASARHVAQVIESLDGYNQFVIETNGFMLGLEPSIVDAFKDYDNIFWRVTIKGHDASTFEKVTGCQGKYYQLPLMAIDFLAAEGLNYQVAFNPDIVKRSALKLPPGADIEFERMRSYAGVKERMKSRGIINLENVASPTRSPKRAQWKPTQKEGDEWSQV
jgi:uncharacterized Fe-S cluster-containing radical SAM superfamily protein